MKTSKELLDAAGKYLAGGVLHHATALRGRPPIVVTRANASRIWDAGGKSYIDYYMGSAALPLGHAHPEVLTAVRAQEALGTHSFELSPPAIELAELIAEMVPSVERVKYATSGTEAVLAAIRVARTVTGRDKILKFEGAYHGSHDPVLWAYRPTRKSNYPAGEADSLGVPAAYGQQILVAPYNDAQTTTAIIEKFKDELAAVVAEPMLGNIEPAKGFLETIRDLTTRHRIPLIFDEVVTGFRLAPGGAQEYYGVVPDMTALGKSLGGGYPIGALGGRADLMELFSPESVKAGRLVRHVGTHSGNPVSCAAAVATLKILRRPGAYERLHAIAAKLADGLRGIAKARGIDVLVVNVGPMVDMWFTTRPVRTYADYAFADSARGTKFKLSLLDRGIWSPPGMKMFLSLAHTDADVDETLEAADQAMASL